MKVIVEPTENQTRPVNSELIMLQCPEGKKLLLLRGQCLQQFILDPQKNQITEVLYELMSQSAIFQPIWIEWFADLQIGNSRSYSVRFMGYIIQVIDPNGEQAVENDNYTSLDVVSYEKIEDESPSGGGLAGGGPNLGFICEDVSFMAPSIRFAGQLGASKSLGLPVECTEKLNGTISKKNYLASMNLTLNLLNLVQSAAVAKTTVYCSFPKKARLKTSKSLRVDVLKCSGDLWDTRTISNLSTEDVIPKNETLSVTAGEFIEVNRESALSFDRLFVKIRCEFTRDKNLFCELSLSDSADGFSAKFSRKLFKNISALLNVVAPQRTAKELGRLDVILSLAVVETQLKNKRPNQHLTAGFFD